MHDRVGRGQESPTVEAGGGVMGIDPVRDEGVSTLAALVASAAAALDASAATIVLYDELGNLVASVPHRRHEVPRWSRSSATPSAPTPCAALPSWPWPRSGRGVRGGGPKAEGREHRR